MSSRAVELSISKYKVVSKSKCQKKKKVSSCSKSDIASRIKSSVSIMKKNKLEKRLYYKLEIR